MKWNEIIGTVRSLWTCLWCSYHVPQNVLQVVCSGVTTMGVTRGGNWGYHPYFFFKNGDIFPPLFIFSWKTDDLFCSPLSLFSISLRCHPLGGCHSTPFFYLSDLVCPQSFVNLPTKISLRVSPPWTVSPGAVLPTPPLLMPLVVCSTLRHKNTNSFQYLLQTVAYINANAIYSHARFVSEFPRLWLFESYSLPFITCN